MKTNPSIKTISEVLLYLLERGPSAPSEIHRTTLIKYDSINSVLDFLIKLKIVNKITNENISLIEINPNRIESVKEVLK